MSSFLFAGQRPPWLSSEPWVGSRHAARRPRPGDAQTKLEVRMRSTARGSARGKGRTRKAPSHRRRPSHRARPEGGAELKSRLLRSAAKDAGPVHRAQDECTIRLTYVRANYRRSTILQSFA